MVFGDLAFLCGAIGIFIYCCLISVRYASNSGRLGEKTRKYEAEVERLRERLEVLKAERATRSPQVDEIMERMIALRNERDTLQMQYEDMVAEVQHREMVIKTKRMS